MNLLNFKDHHSTKLQQPSKDHCGDTWRLWKWRVNCLMSKNWTPLKYRTEMWCRLGGRTVCESRRAGWVVWPACERLAFLHRPLSVHTTPTPDTYLSPTPPLNTSTFHHNPCFPPRPLLLFKTTDELPIPPGQDKPVQELFYPMGTQQFSTCIILCFNDL